MIPFSRSVQSSDLSQFANLPIRTKTDEKNQMIEEKIFRKAEEGKNKHNLFFLKNQQKIKMKQSD